MQQATFQLWSRLALRTWSTGTPKVGKKCVLDQGRAIKDANGQAAVGKSNAMIISFVVIMFILIPMFKIA